MSTQSNEIEANVFQLVALAGVTFSAIYRGEKRKALGGDTPMDEWSCAFTKGDGREAHEEFEFFTGLGHRTKMEDTAIGRMAARSLKGSHPRSLAWEDARKAHCKPKAPHVATVLHSLILDSDALGQSFATWCDEFGYDSDSRKALRTYEACQENAEKLLRVFSRAQVGALREALQDY